MYTQKTFITTLCFAIFSTGLFFTALYLQWFGAGDMKVSPFCEACHQGLIKEPANTLSNFGFVISGLCIAWLLSKNTFSSNRNDFTTNPKVGLLYSCMVVFLGPGSMAMHATQTHIGGFFDMLSMYLIASFISSYGIKRYFKLATAPYLACFFVALAICIWANFTYWPVIFQFFGNTAFAFFLSIGIFFEFLNIYVKHYHHEKKWAFYALGALLAAFTIWNLSRTESPYCHPDSIFQGHAAWHLGTALSTFFLFRYYVSEHQEMA